MSLNRLNHSPNVNHYLALTLRKMAMPEQQTQELTDLEDAMDELWYKLLDVEIEEINALIPQAFASIRETSSSVPPPPRQSRAAAIARSVDVAIIGQAFRNVLVDGSDFWQMRESSPFVPMIVDSLAHLPDLAPSDTQYGEAFLKVLRDPNHVWSETPVWAFINMVTERSTILDARAKLEADNKPSSPPSP